MSVFVFPVDYATPVKELIERGKFDSPYINLKSESLPARGRGNMTVNVRLMDLNKVITVRELALELPDMVDPHTALHFALANPDEQHKYPLATVWQNEKGAFFCLIIFGRPSGNSLSIHGIKARCSFGKKIRFMVYSSKELTGT